MNGFAAIVKRGRRKLFAFSTMRAQTALERRCSALISAERVTAFL